MNKKFILLSSVLAFLTIPAQAQIITFIGDTVYSPTTAAPGDTSDYTYFAPGTVATDASTTVSNLNNFSVTPLYLSNLNPAPSPTYSLATAPDGTEFNTGVEYDTPATYDPDPMFTFSLTNATESNFNVYVLLENSNVSQGTVLLTDARGATSTTQTLANPGTQTDDYAEFSVTGAMTSDVFTLSVGDSGYRYPLNTVGGVTFEDTTEGVPEPSTYALLLGGVALLAFRLRRLRA